MQSREIAKRLNQVLHIIISIMVSQRKHVVGRVYIVRHGETEENKQGIIQGQTDTQLNELGRLQAEKVGHALQGKVLRAAYSSDLARAADVSANVGWTMRDL